ncbi:MAG: ParA family protein [Planctomycetota bacterium]
MVLIDVGPNLGAINRAALIASEHVVIPLGPDLFSLQGLRNLGPQLREWRRVWTELRKKSPDRHLDLPAGQITPLGYVVMQHGMRVNRPPKAYQRWIERFPGAYRECVLDETEPLPPSAERDPHCLAMLKHYRSLIPMAMEAKKPVFALNPADGAIGAHGQAVRSAYDDFLALAQRHGGTRRRDAEVALPTLGRQCAPSRVDKSAPSSRSSGTVDCRRLPVRLFPATLPR